MNLVDLILVLLLAGAFMLGFFQGAIRMLFALAAWLLSFILAAHLRGPVGSWLSSQWRDIPVAYSEMIAFGFLFFLIFVASLLLIQGAYRRSPRLFNVAMVDELLGGLGGVAIGLLVVAATAVSLDYFYAADRTLGVREVAWIADLNQMLANSAVADVLRATIIPALGSLLGPLLPSAVLAVMR